MAAQIFSDWRAIPKEARGATVALGNFDGVHLGHVAVLKAAQAARPDLPLAVLTFEPHPREHFRPDDPAFRLTLLPAKAACLADCRRRNQARSPNASPPAPYAAPDPQRLPPKALRSHHQS